MQDLFHRLLRNSSFGPLPWSMMCTNVYVPGIITMSTIYTVIFMELVTNVLP